MFTQKISLVIVLFVVPVALLLYYGLMNGSLNGTAFVPDIPRGTVELSLRGFPIYAQTARTPEERRQGLSGRSALGEREGMLFYFDEPGLHGIWMKDMRFPIDVLWLNEAGIVLDIERGLTPESYPQVFYPSAAASYAVELSAGTAELYNVALGDAVLPPSGL